MIDPETYADLMRVMAPLLALLFWGVAAALTIEARRNGQMVRRVGSIAWSVHVALWWSVQTILRLAYGYAEPTMIMSLWALVVYAHAGMSLAWMAYMLWHYGIPADLSIPPEWEGSNDD